MVFAEKFHNVETAFVHVEVNIAFFEIRCDQFPYLCFGIHPFNHFPCMISQSPAVKLRIKIKQIHGVAVGDIVYAQSDSSGFFAIGVNVVNRCLWVVENLHYFCIGNNFAIFRYAKLFHHCYG